MEEWKTVANWLWLGLLGVIKLLWDKQEDRFKKGESKMSALEAAIYSKEDARERKETVDEALEARRMDVKEIYATIAERGRVNEARHEKTNDKIDALSREMNNGLSDIKSILLDRR